MHNGSRIRLVLTALGVVFLGLTAAFWVELWGHPAALRQNPLVDPAFLDTATWRKSYADLIRAKEDLSDFDCYGCHDKKSPPKLRFDANQKIVVPDEHSDVVMGHGTHGRNNNCYNCHDEQNLLQLAPRDGRALKLDDSTPLCGSCHGPTYRDWEAGVHGRTNGYWNRALGPSTRQNCVNCHNPHSPKFPGRKPAPGPIPLRQPAPAPHSAEPTP
jgi:hypothetical protein